MASKNSKWMIIGLSGFLIVLLFAGQIVNFITDIQWFDNLGYLTTFLTAIKYQALLFVPLFLLFLITMKIYLDVIFDKYLKLGHISLLVSDIKKNKRRHLWVSLVAALFLGLTYSQSLWFSLLQLINTNTFGLTDPLFNHDVSFYMFVVPFLQIILRLGIITIVLWVGLTVAFYAVVMQLYPPAEGKLFYINPANGPLAVMSMIKRDIFANAVKRLAILGAAFYVLLGLTFLMMAYDTLYSKRGIAFGASFTDVHVTLRAMQALALISFVSAPVFFVGLIRNKKKWLASGPILLVAVGVLSSGIALVVQNLVVEPDEINKEKPYLTYNIEYTQKAFALDQVEVNEFPVEQKLTKELLASESATIDNIRINDEGPLLQIYNQIQAIRLYYEFNHITMDRYTIDGKYKQMFISPRELNIEKLDPKARTWINEHLKYTHGYGIVASPVNEVESEGLPKLYYKNIPPTTETDFKLSRPEIYFGEKTDPYVIVGTKENEFNYPAGSNNEETRYEGKDGISLKGINRLLYAIREGSLRLFLSSNVTDESKILIHRNLYERVNRIAPFLIYDQTPQLVVNQEDGGLYWIIDAYTASANYPYAQRYGFKGYLVNYVRNSVKVVVSAYDGTVDFYQVDAADPVANTYGKIYQGLLKPVSECPTELFNHFKYPKDLFNVQAEVYKTYHVNNPVVFYNGEDMWDIANEKYLSEVQAYQPSYTMFKLPGETKAEFALTQPFTPREKANMTALLVARNDGENYGKLYAFQLPKDKTIDGPMMIETRIDQDSVISPQFTLWGQEGSSVLRGNVMIIPVLNSLLYVEPIYLKAENENSIPEVKRVVVVYKDQIVMEKTLKEGLAKIFGDAVPEAAANAVETKPSADGSASAAGTSNAEVQVITLEEAKAIYEELQNAMDKVNTLIQKLEKDSKK